MRVYAPESSGLSHRIPRVCDTFATSLWATTPPGEQHLTRAAHNDDLRNAAFTKETFQLNFRRAVRDALYVHNSTEVKVSVDTLRCTVQPYNELQAT